MLFDICRNLYRLILLCIAILQVAGRSLGELVRKLGERVLPSIIPILSQGLKDPSASRRQVSYLNKIYLEDIQFVFLFICFELSIYLFNMDSCFSGRLHWFE